MFLGLHSCLCCSLPWIKKKNQQNEIAWKHNVLYSIMSLSLPEIQTIGCQCCGELGTVVLNRELWNLMMTDTIWWHVGTKSSDRSTPQKIWEAQTTRHVRTAGAGCARLLSGPKVFSRVAKLQAGTTNPFGTRLCCQGCVYIRRQKGTGGRSGGWVGEEHFHQNQLCMTPACCGEPDALHRKRMGSGAGKRTGRQRVGKNKVRAADYVALVCLASSK